MTFDVPLFALISVFAVAALAVAVPGQVKRIMSIRTGIKAPVPLVMAGAVLQQSVFAIGLAAAGAALAPKTGLEAPWFLAVSRGEGLGLSKAVAQLLPALVVGGVCTLAFLLLYYQLFRPRMSDADIARTEGFRTSMGLTGRLLMGGVAEEVMFRWGVMSAMAWVTVSLFGMPADLGMWAAIVSAGVLFGLGHLPGVMAAGVKITKLIVAAALALNMVVSLACGWLFWQHGLLAAMIAHALLHAVWHPMEKT
jgi:hypothetical protein